MPFGVGIRELLKIAAKKAKAAASKANADVQVKKLEKSLRKERELLKKEDKPDRDIDARLLRDIKAAKKDVVEVTRKDKAGKRIPRDPGGFGGKTLPKVRRSGKRVESGRIADNAEVRRALRGKENRRADAQRELNQQERN